MVRAAGLSTRWTTLGPYLLTRVMSFPPPSFGGQAPLPASEGGAEPSGKEASPVRSAPAPALGPYLLTSNSWPGSGK